MIALMFALQSYSTESMERRATPLASLVVRELVRWVAWGVVSPLIFAVVRRVARDGIGSVKTIAAERHPALSIGVRVRCHRTSELCGDWMTSDSDPVASWL